MSETTSFVALSGISKAFSSVKVLKDVSFDVRAGEIHALLGENGAGKSTLIKILSGLYTPDAGTIVIDGKEMKFASTRDATAAGIATVYQELLLFPELSVAENVFLGNYPRTGPGGADTPATCLTRSKPTISTSTPRCCRCRSPSASVSRSPRRCRRMPACSSWTSRPPRWSSPTSSN